MGPQGQCRHPSLPCDRAARAVGRAGEEWVEGHIIRGLPTPTREIYGVGAEE